MATEAIVKIRSEQVDEMVAALVMKWQKVPVGEIVGVLGILGTRWMDDEEVWQTEDGSVMLVSEWKPSTDRGQAMMAFEKCPGMRLHCLGPNQFSVDWGRYSFYRRSLPPAICGVALWEKGVKVNDD